MNESYINLVRESLYKRKSNSTEEKCQIKSSDRNKVGKMKKSNRNKNDVDRIKNANERKKLERKIKKPRLDVSETLLPSTSGNSDFTVSDTGNKSNETDENFDLNDYFSSREQSFNASVIEPHSGIDYEFLNSATNNTKINSSKIIETSKNMKMKRKKKRNSITDKDEQNSTIEIISSLSLSDSEESSKLDKIEEMNSSKIMENNNKNTKNKRNEKREVLNTDQDMEISTIEKVSSSSLPDSKPDEVEEISNYAMIENRTDSTYFEVEGERGEKLVVLGENQSISCYGFCYLKVLHGSLDVLGYKLVRSNPKVPLYSPRGSSLLLLKNSTKEETNYIEDLKETFPCLRDIEIDKTSVVFACIKIEKSYDIAFIENYISQQIFPKIDKPTLPQIILNPTDKFNVVNINEEWDFIVNSVINSTKLLIVGGKGVGKSTFLRYSINKLLDRFEKIRVIDLDPGQSEFSIPGCISILTVKNPILGPNYIHLRTTERSYLSNINVGRDPTKYVRCVKTLMETVDREDLPTVINYMGFAQGIGINIVSAAITFIRPTDVVQIDSRSLKKNFKVDVTPKNVQERCDLFGGDSTIARSLDYNFFKISAMSDDNYGWSLEPRQARDMCVLSYFGKLMDEDTDRLTSPNVPVYKISLPFINIFDDRGRNISPAAVNANLVALSTQIVDEEFFEIVGYGIVRGIDEKTKTLYLISPEPFDVLKRVFYLVLTDVCLPPSIYMTSKDVSGCIPYVMDGELESLGQITKRSYVPTYKK